MRCALRRSAALLFVVGLLVAFPSRSWSSVTNPFRMHNPGTGWHTCTGFWNVYDGPGREDGLVYIFGESQGDGKGGGAPDAGTEMWGFDGRPPSGYYANWFWRIQFGSSYGGQVSGNYEQVISGNVPGDHQYLDCPHGKASLNPFKIQIKSTLDNLYALPGYYRFLISPGQPIAQDMVNSGTVEFKYSPLNGGIDVLVVDSAGAPVVNGDFEYNVETPDRQNVTNSHFWILGKTDSSGHLRITRGVASARHLMLKPYGFPRAHLNVVGFQGDASSHYKVTMGSYSTGSAEVVERLADDAAGATGATACATGEHWSGTGCVADSGGATACATGYHWVASSSSCVPDAAAGSGSGTSSGPTDPAFWTKEFWIDILKSVFIPSNVTLSRWSTLYDRLSSWGPFGAARALSVDYASHTDYAFDTDPVWTFRNPIQRLDMATNTFVDASPIVFDLRPALNQNSQPGGYGGFGRKPGFGSFMGSLVYQFRRLLGLVVYVGAGYLLVGWVRPRVQI